MHLNNQHTCQPKKLLQNCRTTQAKFLISSQEHIIKYPGHTAQFRHACANHPPPLRACFRGRTPPGEQGYGALKDDAQGGEIAENTVPA